MKRAPKVIIKNGKYYYKYLNTYKYKFKPFTGYKGGYWAWEWNDNGELYKAWLFYTIELSEWQIENAMIDVLRQWKII